MLKNKGNIIAMGLMVLFVCNNMAMDAPSDKNLTDRLGGNFAQLPNDLMVAPGKILDHVVQDHLESSATAGRMVANLSLINKDMHEYVTKDEFTDNVVIQFRNRQGEIYLEGKSIEYKHPMLLKALIKGSKKDRLEFELFALSHRCSTCSGEIKPTLEEILAAGIDINHRFADPQYNEQRGELSGGTALTRICSQRFSEGCGGASIIKTLTDQPGIDLTAQDNRGNTPVMWAVNSRNMDALSIFQHLSKNGRDIGINYKNKDGETPLFYWARVAWTQPNHSTKYPNCTKLAEGTDQMIFNGLLDAGAKPYIANNNGETVINLLEQKDPELADKLKNSMLPKKMSKSCTII